MEDDLFIPSCLSLNRYTQLSRNTRRKRNLGECPTEIFKKLLSRACTTAGRNFKEVVKDREQMEQFHRFLVSRGGDCEVQLLFWLAVEDLKSTMTNESVCTRKMDRIVSHFFKDSEARRGDEYSSFSAIYHTQCSTCITCMGKISSKNCCL